MKYYLVQIKCKVKIGIKIFNFDKTYKFPTNTVSSSSRAIKNALNDEEKIFISSKNKIGGLYIYSNIMSKLYKKAHDISIKVYLINQNDSKK